MAQGETDAVRAFFDRYGRLLYAAAFVCGLSFAMKSAVTGAVVGAIMGGLTSAFSGGNVLEGTASGLMNGLFDGFMWGGITAGVSNVIKPGSFCFIAGTKVLTDSGQKNIEDIEVGDQVLAYDEETGVTAYKPVLHLFRNTTKEWCTVSIRGNDGELYEITSTPGHKYFVPSNRVRKDSRALEHASYAGLSEKWVSACDLKRGDKVLLSDGTLCEVDGVSCKKLSVPETTYNLEVAEFHTYYVSDACVLVHNLNCGKSGRGKKLAPDPKAKGPHTTFKRDPSGKVTHYATYQPNSRNPSGFDEILRFDRVGKAHGGVPTPHVHTPQEVRPAFMWEIP